MKRKIERRKIRASTTSWSFHFAFHASHQPNSPIGFLSSKFLPPSCAVLLFFSQYHRMHIDALKQGHVYIYIYVYIDMFICLFVPLMLYISSIQNACNKCKYDDFFHIYICVCLCFQSRIRLKHKRNLFFKMFSQYIPYMLKSDRSILDI